MPLYLWRGVQEGGRYTQGKMFSRSYNDLEQRLLERSIGLITARSSLLCPRFPVQEKDRFFAHLASLLEAHLPLYQALTLCAQQVTGVYRLLYEAFAWEVLQGRSLSVVLKDFGYGDQVCLALISAGESTGRLTQVLLNYSEYRTFLQKIRGEMRKALVTPACTALFFSIILMVLLIFFVPMIRSYLELSLVSVPLVTQILFWLSATLYTISWYQGSVFVCLVCILVILLRTKKGREVDNAFKNMLPTIGSLRRQTAQLHILMVLALLTQQAVPLYPALGVCAELFYAQEIKKIQHAVKSGRSFSTAWEESIFGCEETVALMSMGLSTGRLGPVLHYAASLKYKSLEKRLSLIISLINPCLVVALSCAIGSVAYGLYMPIITFATTLDL